MPALVLVAFCHVRPLLAHTHVPPDGMSIANSFHCDGEKEGSKYEGQEANRLIQSSWQAESRLRHLNKEQNIATAVSSRPGGLARSGQRILRFLRTLELALQVRHERRNLLAMDDRTLKDLGLNGIAYSEATRPFWDVPLDRLRAIRWRGASRRRRGG